MIDLFLIAAEPSADLQGAKLVTELLRLHPGLRIAAMAGPRMRELPIEVLYRMEDLQVMGFFDVFIALPKIVKMFLAIRARILELQPKAVVCIDYPGFNLRLEKSLRKKGFQNKLIHYVCPAVWAWGKKRIPLMAQNLDLLMALFPFEKDYFADTSLRVEYVGHPLATAIHPLQTSRTSKILGLFPGSRKTVIDRNFPFQLSVVKKLMELDPSLQAVVSISHPDREKQIRDMANGIPLQFVLPKENYALMQKCRLALATSGTVTLELALHHTPTIVNYSLSPFDLFLAKRVFKIFLPYYCIANIVASGEVFPEFIGPNLTKEKLFFAARKIWFDDEKRANCQKKCNEMRELLGEKAASSEAAHLVLSSLG